MRSGSMAGGFLRLAKEAGVPIVPVVAHGGQETFIPLTDGRRLAQALRLDKLGRLKVLPVSLALPWGLNIGDLLGHFPLPAKITMQVLDAISPRDRLGPDPTPQAVHDEVLKTMQATMNELAAERRWPIIG